MSHAGKLLGLSCVLLVLLSLPMSAQDWRSITASRQVHGEDRLQVDLEFASGTFQLSAGRDNTLYRAALEYDAEYFKADNDYNPQRRLLHLSVTPDEIRRGIELDENAPQFIRLELSPAVPVSLDLQFGAARADVALGGLMIHTAEIKTGASESVISFDRPNRSECARFDVIAGGAEFRLEGLGNARCSRITLTGGAGQMVADFTGAWPAGTLTRTAIKLGVGSLTLRLPDNVGVLVDITRIFASFDATGFEKRGSHYVSPNYDAADAFLEIDLDTALSSIDVEWVRNP
jgi:hypothetical protein